MEKTFPGIFVGPKGFAHTYLNLFFPNYIHRTKDHLALSSEIRFIDLGLNYAQHSNTPARQHSDTMLSADPLNVAFESGIFDRLRKPSFQYSNIRGSQKSG